MSRSGSDSDEGKASVNGRVGKGNDINAYQDEEVKVGVSSRPMVGV